MWEPPEKLFLFNDIMNDDVAFSRFVAWSEYAPKVSSPLIRIGIVVGFSVLSLAALSSLPWYMAPVGWVGMSMCFFGLHAISSSCSNDSLAQSARVNKSLGWLCSLLTLTAYESWNVQRKKLLSTSTNTRSITLWMTGGDLWMWTSLVSWIMNSFFPQRMPGMHSAQKRVVANVIALYCSLLAVGVVLWRAGVTTWPTFKFYFIPLVIFHIINSAMIRFQINNDPSTVLSAMKARAEQMHLSTLSPYQMRQLLGEANAYFRAHTYPAWIRWMNLVFGVDVITTLSEDALAFCSNPLSFIPEFRQLQQQQQHSQSNIPLADMSAARIQQWFRVLQLESVIPDIEKYPHLVDGALLAEAQGPTDLEMISSELLRRKAWRFIQDAIHNGIDLEQIEGHASKFNTLSPVEPAVTETAVTNMDEEEGMAEQPLFFTPVELEKQLSQARDELKAKEDELALVREQREQMKPDQALQTCIEALELGLSRAVQAAESYREEVMLLRSRMTAPFEEGSDVHAFVSRIADNPSQEVLQARVEALEVGLTRAVSAAESYREEVLLLQTKLDETLLALKNKQQECESIEVLKGALESCLERAMTTSEAYRQEINSLRQEVPNPSWSVENFQSQIAVVCDSLRAGNQALTTILKATQA